MPFPVKSSGAQSMPISPAQSSLGVPTPPAGAVLGNPPPPPTPPAAAAEPKYYVAIGGKSVLMPKSEAQQRNPNDMCMTEDQTSGWKTVAELLPMANSMRPGVTQPGGFAARVGQPQAYQGAASGSVPPNLYAGVENAQVTRRGANFTEGQYICKLGSAEYKVGRQKSYVILELEVITSSYDAAIPATHESLREGAHATIFIALNDSFRNNIKEIVLACSGFDSEGKWRDENDVVTQQECEALTSTEQAYAGALVYLEAKQILTKENKPFTRISWWPCPVKADGTPDTDKLFSQVRI